MTGKLARLADFQVFMRPTGLAADEQRRINEALFATYEPVRLWLKERDLRAPFRKLVVSLSDESGSANWHGNVMNALNVCEVTEAIALPMAVQHAADHRWVLGIVEDALRAVNAKIGWSSAELESFLKAISDQPLPLVHFFESLAKVDPSSKIRCVPWFSVQPGKTQIGVRIGERDVVVVSEAGPLYLEDSFPVAKSGFRGQEYLLLDKRGNVLASVPVVDEPLTKSSPTGRET